MVVIPAAVVPPLRTRTPNSRQGRLDAELPVPVDGPAQAAATQFVESIDDRAIAPVRFRQGPCADELSTS